MKFLFLMELLLLLVMPVETSRAGDPQIISPERDLLTCLDYATAYLWDMYGALENKIL